MVLEKADGPRGSGRLPTLIVCIALLALGLAVRLWRLGAAPLWYDERVTLVDSRGVETPPPASTALVSSEPLLQDSGTLAVAARSAAHDQPTYVVVIHLWTKLAGDSEFALRLPSALAGALSVPLLFLIGARLVERRAAILAGVLFAVAPLHVSLCQEARTYGITVAFAVASLLALLVADRTRSGLAAFLYGAIAGTVPIFHLLAGIMVAPQLAWLVLRRTSRRRLLTMALGALVPWVVATPIHIWDSILTADQQSGVAFAAPAHGLESWARPATPANLAAAAAYAVSALAGVDVSVTPWRTRQLLLLTVPILALIAWGLRRLARPEQVLLGLGLVAPLAVAAGMSVLYGHVVPFQARYVSWAVPNAALLVATGAWDLRTRVWHASTVLPVLLWAAFVIPMRVRPDPVPFRFATVKAAMACYQASDVIVPANVEDARAFVAFGGHPVMLALPGTSPEPSRSWHVGAGVTCGVAPPPGRGCPGFPCP
jgi:uncharacterized membrane protein